MLGWEWLKRQFGDPFPKQRIFPFRDGAGRRAADPVVVERVLIDKLGEGWKDEYYSIFAHDPPGMIGVEVDKIKEQKREKRLKVLDAINEAFLVDEFDDADDHSMTEESRLGLLLGFIMFADALIENSRPFGKPRSRDSPGTDPSPTSSGSDATSTDEPLKIVG